MSARGFGPVGRSFAKEAEAAYEPLVPPSRAVTGQSIVIDFGTTFYAIALLFVIAAPVLIGFRIGLLRHARRRAERT